ncbi:T-cell antigen CD7 isoform X2 [Aquila chrysaetos chrysaetos]|uniref:T-cell antigen CD7 isoform X2 n=1 Tax=Aquila chrysaetos chrysaetos TaxID=223781 RepID=UPI001B7D3D7F|nr:T-cell antigen CD7 isoform X2 [Aquila chrysaetos chrysaetos]
MGHLGEHPTLLELRTQGSLMDSPHLAWLCFLLLTVAAPRPNIAMPHDDPTEGTQGSSFGKTSVTVYHCKDCESNICKSSNYEDFVKIGETQREKFSNEIIQLVTSETHIVMCFQQGNTFPEGLYAIVWERAMGVGDSCGIPNSGASSENGRGNMVKVCCEVETDPSVPKPPLKCYTKITDEKIGETDNITGNPQFSIGEKSSIGIIAPVLILGVCGTAMAVYCVRQNRNSQAKTSEVVEQSPLYVNPQQGQSINITCALKSSHEDEGFYLLKTQMQPERVLYVSSQNGSTIFPAFANRLEFSKEEKKILITLHNLQKNDSDVYVCAGMLKSSTFLSVNRSGTMVLVKEVEQTHCSNNSWGIYGLIIVVALLFFALICCTLYRVDMKKYFQKRKPNAVYEDMSYSSRRNTLIRANAYVTDN